MEKKILQTERKYQNDEAQKKGYRKNIQIERMGIGKIIKYKYTIGIL